MSFSPPPGMPEPGGGQPSGGGYDSGGLIGAIIGLGSTIYETEASKSMMREQNKANRNAAELAYSRELEMWNKMNEYNSPEQQMARYKAAGLNPNLMYGQGNSGQASQLPKYHAPTLQYQYKPLDIPSVLGQYQDFAMRQAQINNVKANTEATRERTFATSLANKLNEFINPVKGERAAKEWEYDRFNLPYMAEGERAKARQETVKVDQAFQKLTLMEQQQVLNKLRAKGMETENEIKGAELLFKQYRNEWMKMGITTSDNPVLRVLTRMLQESGMDVGGWINSVVPDSTMNE